MTKPADGRQSASARGYGYRWAKARAGYLRSHPLCVDCARRGRTTAASVVDHISPHRGDQSLFWDRANWQALCAPCHDRHKQRLERSGAQAGCDVDGLPLDPNHYWSKATG